MRRVRNISLYVLAVFLVLICADAINGLLNSPYTDQDIVISLVDTWQVEALATIVILGVVCIAIFLSAALAYRSSEASSRRLPIVTLALAMLAGILVICSHIVLTHRTTALTGQTFSGFYGLP